MAKKAKEGDLVYLFDYNTVSRIEKHPDTGKLVAKLPSTSERDPNYVEIGGVVIVIIRGILDLWPVIKDLIDLIKRK